MPALEGDSWTTQALVEARCQKGAFTTTTTPTGQQCLEFMKTRAALIQTTLWKAGLSYTVPTGSNPIPTGSPTDYEKALASLCSLANELFAAGDSLAARDVNNPGAPPAEAVAYWDEGRQVVKQLEELARAAFGVAAESSHTQTGGISKASFSGSEPDMPFTLDTMW